MHRLTILYPRPSDPVAFRRYYEETHVPLARRMRGLTGWTLSWVGADDPSSRWLLVADLYTASGADMDAVLASPEGRAASADLGNFDTGGVEFLRGEEEEVALS